jgi:membrane associated rhomboid family serine protease
MTRSAGQCTFSQKLLPQSGVGGLRCSSSKNTPQGPKWKGPTGKQQSPKKTSQNPKNKEGVRVQKETGKKVEEIQRRTRAENKKMALEEQVMMKQELDIQKDIRTQRKRLLRPGLFSVFAIASIWVGCAYLDTRIEVQDDLAPRTVSESRWLTPTVIKEQVIAGWKELDKMTITLILSYVSIHMTRRLPSRFWQNLSHIAGERNWTLLTYPFVHSSWGAVLSSATILTWFLPTVVRDFGGDYFHIGALYLSIPVLTGFLTHLQFRGPRATAGIPIEMGPSGALAAIMSAFAIAHPQEKIFFGPVRMEAGILAVVLLAYEGLSMIVMRGRRISFISHSVSARDVLASTV